MGVTVKMMEHIHQMCERHQEPEMYNELVAWVFEMGEVSWDDVQLRYMLLQFPYRLSIKEYFNDIKEQYHQVISRLALMHEMSECN